MIMSEIEMKYCFNCSNFISLHCKLMRREKGESVIPCYYYEKDKQDKNKINHKNRKEHYEAALDYYNHNFNKNRNRNRGRSL